MRYVLIVGLIIIGPWIVAMRFGGTVMWNFTIGLIIGFGLSGSAVVFLWIIGILIGKGVL